MRRFITTIMAVVLTVGAAAQAQLLLVENFETLTGGTVDGKPASGVLGGQWDTHTENTGNLTPTYTHGSVTLPVQNRSNGDARGTLVFDLTNKIENTEAGVLFFRFIALAENKTMDTYMGIHTLTGSDPLVADTMGAAGLTAGFVLIDDEQTNDQTLRVATPDKKTILTKLNKGQWYNVWIVADNAADRFDLYMAKVTGPGAPAPLPIASNAVAAGVPFNLATTQPLNGAFFTVPGHTAQRTTCRVDDLYWDGDAGVPAGWALNPMPDKGATGILTDQILSWDAPNDPNIAQIVDYSIYLDPNGVRVADGDARALVKTNQSATRYDPTPNLAHDTTYYWRVDTTMIMKKTQARLTIPGWVWSFTTESAKPSFTLQPVDLLVDAGQSGQFSVAADSITPITFTWYRSTDNANNTPDDDQQVGASTLLNLTGIQIDQEGCYYCKATNGGGSTPSDTAKLAVRRLMAHWTLDGAKVADGKYQEETGQYPAAIAGTATFIAGANGNARGASAIDTTNGWATAGTWNPSELSQRLTVCFWLFWNGTNGTYQSFVAKRSGDWSVANILWQISTNNNGNQLQFQNPRNTLALPDALTAGQWQHIAVSHDGTTARIYLNGEQRAAGAFLLGDGMDALLTLGCNSDGREYTHGALDDVRIYNHDLDPVTIGYLFSDVSGSPACVDRQNPALAFDFDGDCAVNLADLQLLANNWLDCFRVPDCVARP